MSRGSEFTIRAALTIAAAGAVVGLLAATGYDWDFRPVWRYRRIYGSGLLATLGATGVAYAFGLGVGIFVALARLSRLLPVRHLGDLYVEVIRGTPFLVQLLIAYFCIAPLLGIDSKFWTGAIALGAFAGAYIGEVFRAGIESIDRGQFEAARSLGLSRARTLRHIVLPQAVKRMIPPLTGELIALTKESSLLYVISFLELSFAAQQVSSRTIKGFEAYLVAAGLYLCITVPLSVLARRLERRLGRSERRGVAL